MLAVAGAVFGALLLQTPASLAARFGIDVRVRHDALGDHRLRFGKVRRHQAFRRVGRHPAGRALLRLAVHPAVEALPGLLAQLSGIEQALQAARRLGVARNTLRSKMRRYGLGGQDADEDEPEE